MKIYRKSIVLMLAAGLFLTGLLFAEEGVSGKNTEKLGSLQKPHVADTGSFDGNRIDNDLENNGMIVSHNISGRSGMTWPKGNNTQTVYASGIWVAGKVGGQVRIAAGEYGGEFSGGPWGSDPSDPYHKLYKVNKTDLDDPAAHADFQNWPTAYGAPWVDNNDNGIYEPLPNGPDHPEFIGDQVVWAVMNDGDPTQHVIFQTAPLGIEMQMTVFGFDRMDAFGDMMFVKELIINRGGHTITNMYIGLWSDPDLGDAGDDFVGCDTTLSLGICYNDGVDRFFASYVGGTPAVGYDFFQGPIVPAPGETALVSGREIPDYKNLKMSSFTKYINGDPVYFDPHDAIEAYNYMMGFMPDGSDFPVEATGGTKFVHPGDPNDDTGPADDVLVDSDLHTSGDRRFLMNVGPFEMAPGDSQEIVFGIFHAAAGSALNSFTQLKRIDRQAQFAYDANFILPSAPRKPEVEITAFENEIILKWDHKAENYREKGPKDPDGNDTYFEFEGYNVYQYETVAGANPKLVVTYDVVNDVQKITDEVFDIRIGQNINRIVQYGTDSGLKRSVSITKDLITELALKTNRVYYFGVTAYAHDEFASPKVLESSPDIKSIRPQVPNTWQATDETGIYGTTVNAEHVGGSSDGSASVVVVDPQAVTGDSYDIFFDTDHYYLDVDGVWKPTALPDAIAKLFDVSPTVVTGTAVTGPGGTLDLHFEVDVHSPDYNYVAGVLITVPGAVINSATGPDGVLAVIQPDGQSVLFGDTDMDGAGDFAGGEVVTINVAFSSVNIPIGFDYIAYDDAWGHLVCDTDGDGVTDPDMVDYCDAYGLGPSNSVIANATGSGTIDELGYSFKSFFVWKVRNTNTGELVVEASTIQGGVAGDHVVDGVFILSHTPGVDANPIAEGLQFMMVGAAPTMKSIGVYANAAGPIDPPVDGLPYWLYPDWLVADGDYTGQQTNGSIWVFNTHPAYGDAGPATFFSSLIVYSGGNGSPNQGIKALIPYDFEMRFTGNGRAYDNWSSGWPNGEKAVPFEFWNIGINTPDDPSDDYQLISWLLDDNGDDEYGLVPVDHPASGGTNDPYTDRVYVYAPTDNTPGTQGHDNWWNNLIPYENVGSWVQGPGENDPGGPMDTWNVFSRTVLMNWNGGDVTDPTFPANVNALLPEIGTVFRFVTTKPNAINDQFSLSTAGFVGKAKAYDPDGIKVWPNPYFGYNPEERDPVKQIVQFTHLPESGSCTIRIFNIAGVPVRTLKHTNGTQFEIWDLKNNSRIPVASGMYIAVVETDKGDKVLKLAIIQPEQRLDVY